MKNLNVKNIDEVFDRLFFKEPVPKYLIMHIYLNSKPAEYEYLLEMSHELIKSKEFSLGDLLFMIIKVCEDDLTTAFVKSFEIVKFPHRAIQRAVKKYEFDDGYEWVRSSKHAMNTLYDKIERVKDIVLAYHLSKILLQNKDVPTTKRRM